MRTTSLSTVCVGLALSLMATGCGAPNPSSSCIPVSLTITYKGQPVEGAQVTFSASGEGARTCQGTTDQSGKAVLGTFAIDDGAMAGSYKVIVSKAAEAGRAAGGISDPALASGDNTTGAVGGGGAGGLAGRDPAAGYLAQMNSDGSFKETPNALPTKYANIDTSGISFTVQGPGANDFTVDLKD